MRRIEIIQEGREWAVKHDGGYLGFAADRQEAERLVELLNSFKPPQTTSEN